MAIIGDCDYWSYPSGRFVRLYTDGCVVDSGTGLMGPCIILSSAVMEEYKFVNPTANPNSGVKVFTLLYGELQKEFTFRPPTLPPNWEEMFVAQEKHVVFLNTIITAILIAIGLLAILYTVFKKCRYVSSLPQVCFPIYPVSNLLWGTSRTDIFVEVINISTAKSIWAYFTTCAVHPSQLRITGYPSAWDMSIIKVCCVRQLQVDWQNIILCDTCQKVVKLPPCGHLSVWQTDSLESIENQQPYQIKVFGQIFDQIMPIEIKDDVMQPPPDYRLY